MKKLSLRIVLAAAFSIPSAYSVAQSASADGEVRKIDLDSGKVTLKHGPIPNLDMDSMTMVFRVREPDLLKNLKAGDRVKFVADRVNGQITILKIEKAK